MVNYGREPQNARQYARKQLNPECSHSVAGNFAMKVIQIFQDGSFLMIKPQLANRNSVTEV